MLDSVCFDFAIDDDLNCTQMEDKFVKDVSNPLSLEESIALD